MAVVKLRYLKSKSHIKAHVRYITHRRGNEEGAITRPLFDGDGFTDKEAAYKMIDNAGRGTLFYKLMLNFDPAKEDTKRDLDIYHITRQTIRHLENLLGYKLQFVATVHNADHTPLRHMHGFFLVQRRLSRAKFRSLQKIAYQTATREARLQRKARDRVLENPRYHRLTRYHTLMQTIRQTRPARHSKPLARSHQPACSSCGYGQITGLSTVLINCPNCRAPLKGKQRQVQALRL
jgi:hypothetical protein